MDGTQAEIAAGLARQQGYTALTICTDRDADDWRLVVRNGADTPSEFGDYDGFAAWALEHPAPKAERTAPSKYEWEEFDPDGPSATPTLTVTTFKGIGTFNDAGRALLENAPFVRVDLDRATGTLRIRPAQQAPKGIPVMYAQKRRFAQINLKAFCAWAGMERGEKHEYVLRKDTRFIIAEPKKDGYDG